jgi:hypothetical protein
MHVNIITASYTPATFTQCELLGGVQVLAVTVLPLPGTTLTRSLSSTTVNVTRLANVSLLLTSAVTSLHSSKFTEINKK